MRVGQELVSFDAFGKEVEDKHDALIRLVTASKEAGLKDIQAKKIRLVEQLGQIQVTIRDKRYKEFAEVVTVLDDQIVYGYEHQADYDVRLFAGALDLQGIEEILEKAVFV